jgi:hypothetical protein
MKHIQPNPIKIKGGYKVKKLIFILLSCALLIAGSSTAFALSWYWDMTGTDVEASIDGAAYTQLINYDNYFGVQNGGVTPLQDVTQSLGADGILNDGDTFSEDGFLREITKDGDPITFRQKSDPTNSPLRAYIKFDGLQGSIFNYDDGGDGPTTIANYGTNLANDTFDLAFTPSVGTLTFYLDEDFDPTNGSTIEVKIADYELLGGGGQGPQPQAGGTQGDLSFKLGFTNVLDNFWFLPDATDFDDWLTAYGANSIFAFVNVDATVQGVSDDGTNLLFSIDNDGKFENLGVVPEPTTMLLFGTGLLGLAAIGRKKFLKK